MNGLSLTHKHLVASTWCSKCKVLIGYTDDMMSFTLLAVIFLMKFLVRMPETAHSPFSGSARSDLIHRVKYS